MTFLIVIYFIHSSLLSCHCRDEEKSHPPPSPPPDVLNNHLINTLMDPYLRVCLCPAACMVHDLIRDLLTNK